MWARSYTLRAILSILLLVGFYGVSLTFGGRHVMGIGLGLLAVDVDGGLAPSERWEIGEEARKEALAANAEVTVTPGSRSTLVHARFGPLVLPQCCAVCLGPVKYEMTQTHTVTSGGNELQMSLPLLACEQHQKEAARMLSVNGYNQATDLVTMSVANPELAELIRRANA